MNSFKPYIVISFIIFGICNEIEVINAAEFVKESQTFYHSPPSGLMKTQGLISERMEIQEMPPSDHQLFASSATIETFISRGIVDNPLPSKQIVQEELMDSGLILKIEEIITHAYEKNPISMVILGGLYVRCVDLEKAQSFLFRAAKAQNPDAFWLLSSMLRNKYISSNITNLDMLLLNEAEKLGSTDATIYKKESGII